jgi:endonuclease/exonuclease/phosphatase family metal-dependent hydrolase
VPKLASDSESERRRAALAKFRDRRTGKLFWFASVHLDARHSTSVTTERSYDALRLAQINAVNAGVAHYNPQKYPVIVGGDFNSWQNSKVASSAHDRLVSLGYYDTSAAVTRVNFSYTTYTAFKTTVPPASHKIGVRLDMMMVKGATGAQRFENVMKATDSSRPSDHNLILSDIVL